MSSKSARAFIASGGARAARAAAAAEAAASAARMRAAAPAPELVEEPRSATDAAAVAAARPPRVWDPSSPRTWSPETVARHLARRRPPCALGLTMREALALAALAVVGSDDA